MKKKTSIEYNTEMNDALDLVKRLDNEARERLLQLSVIRPNAVIHSDFNNKIFAKSLTKSAINFLEFNKVIQFMNAIEEDIAKDNTYIQGKLF